MRVCVIGAGVLGLSTAYELVTRGHHVILVDREGPFAGASSRSFAWINANNKRPSSYHHLNELGVAEHQRFQERFPGAHKKWLHMGGNILADFSGDRSVTYATRLGDAQAENYPVREISRKVLESLEPDVAWPTELETALFYPTEGHLDNDILGEELVNALKDEGASIIRLEAKRVDSGAQGATVLFADGRSELFDYAVIAAGSWSRGLAQASGFSIPAAELSVPTARTHSLLGLTEPSEIRLNRVLISDRINIRPRHDGRMLVQVPRVEHRVEEGESEQLLSEVGAVMEEELRWLFGSDVAIERVVFSGRSFPEDGLSIIGFVDVQQKVYCTVTHSGMTLAPLFAKLAADELEGFESELLTEFRPSRFQNGMTPSDDSYFIGKQ